MTLLKSIFDADLVLRASEAVTATSASPSKAHPLTPSHYSNDAHHETLAVLVRVTALTGSPTSVTVEVQVDSATGFPSATVVGSIPITGVGEYVIPFDLVTVKALEPAAAFIRERVVIAGGTSPSVTLSSRIVSPT